jgi:hypothetical protein
VRDAYLAAAAEVEAVAIVDNRAGIIYATRDGGASFAAEKIMETIHLKGGRSQEDGIVVRRVLRISESRHG